MDIGEMQLIRLCMKKGTRIKESHHKDTKFSNLVPFIHSLVFSLEGRAWQ